ncbi:hypothetical protein J437_LFUL017340 [Ladona fulva]|uniref:Uncharacterized protein n=1 Tax=Ladona fulva TaxID=123851 RepID=A0A8K0KIR2_LADFU|nr:hypothetical protein J437_LFUL017340 [Ladona fulva]
MSSGNGWTLYFKKETNFRVPVSATNRLAVTLRLLASRDSYTSLMYAFQISKQILSEFVPEVCTAITIALRTYIKARSARQRKVKGKRASGARLQRAIKRDFVVTLHRPFFSNCSTCAISDCGPVRYIGVVPRRVEREGKGGDDCQFLLMGLELEMTADSTSPAPLWAEAMGINWVTSLAISTFYWSTAWLSIMHIPNTFGAGVLALARVGCLAIMVAFKGPFRLWDRGSFAEARILRIPYNLREDGRDLLPLVVAGH